MKWELHCSLSYITKRICAKLQLSKYNGVVVQPAGTNIQTFLFINKLSHGQIKLRTEIAWVQNLAWEKKRG